MAIQEINSEVANKGLIDTFKVNCQSTEDGDVFVIGFGKYVKITDESCEKDAVDVRACIEMPVPMVVSFASSLLAFAIDYQKRTGNDIGIPALKGQDEEGDGHDENRVEQ